MRGIVSGLTIDRERIAGLNIHSFSDIKVFTEILSHCLGHECSFSTITENTYIHGKIFVVLLKTMKNVKVYPANISPFTVYCENHYYKENH